MYIEALKSAFTKEGYQDLRYEDFKVTTIKIKNDEILEVSVSQKSGGHARALIGGSIGKLSFNALDYAKEALSKCLDFSRLITGEKQLSPVPIEKENILILTDMDPREIPIEEKINLLKHYCTLATTIPHLLIAEGEYYEQFVTKTFVNNEGSQIYQEQLICGMTFGFTSKQDALTQRTRLAFGGTESYKDMLTQDATVLQKAQQTSDLLTAEPLKGGIYDVILDPEVGALFIHEAFGHLSESDNLLRSDQLRKTMTLGERFASDILNVVDDPTLKGFPGSYVFDDEGVRGKRTPLITNGLLSGRLHSRETAGFTNEMPTGHARAKSYAYTPIVRMGNIYIEPGTASTEDLIKNTPKGVLLFGAAGGQTSGDAFTFTVQGGYLIENGEIKHMLRDLALSGELFTTLKNIDRIGQSLEMRKRGGCGKGGQILLSSGSGSPYIRIKNVAIGGK